MKIKLITRAIHDELNTIYEETPYFSTTSETASRSNEYEKILRSDYIVVRLSDILDSVEYLSTTEGDEYECITIENLKGLAIDNIKEVYEEQGYFGSHWHIDDIIDKAEEMGYECSIKNAMEIAATIMKHDDCNYGITWDTLEYAIEEKFKTEVNE